MEKYLITAAIYSKFFNDHFQKYLLKQTALIGIVCVRKMEKIWYGLWRKREKIFEA